MPQKKTKKQKNKRKDKTAIIKQANDLCQGMLQRLEKARSPLLQSIKCSLDNSDYDPRVGYLVPKGKMVTSELNVSSVQKITRTVFFLEILFKKHSLWISKHKKGNLLYRQRSY